MMKQSAAICLNNGEKILEPLRAMPAGISELKGGQAGLEAVVKVHSREIGKLRKAQ